MPLNYKKVLAYGRGARRKGLMLKDIFSTEDPTKWIKIDQRATKEKEQEENKEPKTHALSSADITAVLWKNDKYIGNFSRYIGTDSERSKVYKEVSENAKTLYLRHRPLIVSLFEKYFTFGSVECNFNSKARLPKSDSPTGVEMISGCSKPYDWEAHHLIPGEAFTTMENTKGTSEEIFTSQQYTLLLQSGYDINHGHNIIALPSNGMDFFQPVHNLIQHPSNHDEYTTHVIGEMKNLKQDLQGLGSEANKPHPDVVVAIATELKGVEDDLWDLLIKVGKKTITAKVEKEASKLEKEYQNLVKYKAETRSTKYKYGALS